MSEPLLGASGHCFIVTGLFSILWRWQLPGGGQEGSSTRDWRALCCLLLLFDSEPLPTPEGPVSAPNQQPCGLLDTIKTQQWGRADMAGPGTGSWLQGLSKAASIQHAASSSCQFLNGAKRQIMCFSAAAAPS